MFLPCHAIKVRHFLLIGEWVLGHRNHRADDEMKNSFVPCSEVIVHDAINDEVAEEPQASGRDENRRYRKKTGLNERCMVWLLILPFVAASLLPCKAVWIIWYNIKIKPSSYEKITFSISEYFYHINSLNLKISWYRV